MIDLIHVFELWHLGHDRFVGDFCVSLSSKRRIEGNLNGLDTFGYQELFKNRQNVESSLNNFFISFQVL